MQYPSAYYLLLLYITFLCRPIIPFMEDMCAHAFYETEHIATVHMQCGSDHAQHEIGKMLDNNDQSKVPTKQKPFEEITAHYPIKNTLVFSREQELPDREYAEQRDGIPGGYLAVPVPPPKQ